MLNSGNSTICLTILFIKHLHASKTVWSSDSLGGLVVRLVKDMVWIQEMFILLYPSFAWCGWWVVDSWTPRPPFVQKKGPSWSRPPDSPQSLLLKSPTTNSKCFHTVVGGESYHMHPHVGVHGLMILNHWWINSYQQFPLYQATTWPRNWASGIRCKNSELWTSVLSIETIELIFCGVKNVNCNLPK